MSQTKEVTNPWRNIFSRTNEYRAVYFSVFIARTNPEVGWGVGDGGILLGDLKVRKVVPMKGIPRSLPQKIV